MAVTLYSTPSCVFCKQVKQYLRSIEIPFTEYDVTRDVRKADEMMRKSGQMGVPVVDVNGKVIVGFNKAELDKALRR